MSKLVKARLIKVKENTLNPEDSTSKLNTKLQDTIDEFRSLGLSVMIEKVYSEMPRSGKSESCSVRDYILVTGYEV